MISTRACLSDNGHALTETTNTARKLAYSLMRILDDECTAHISEPPANVEKPAATNDDWFHAGETALSRFMA